MIAPFQPACNWSATSFALCIVFVFSFWQLRQSHSQLTQKTPVIVSFSAVASCRFCRLKKSRPCSTVSCGFCIDEPHKKRYTIFWRCSRAARCRGVAQLVARLLWEQEAASSSLATPILQTHVDSMRIGVRFCFACETAGKIRMCAKTAHTARQFSKSRAAFFLFPPLLRD